MPTSAQIPNPYDLDLTEAYLLSVGERPLVAGDDWSLRLQARDAAGAVSLTGAVIAMEIADAAGTTLAARQTGTNIVGSSPAVLQIEADANQTTEDLVALTGKGWFVVRFGSESADRTALLAAAGLRSYEVRARLAGDVVRVLFRGSVEVQAPIVDPMP